MKKTSTLQDFHIACQHICVNGTGPKASKALNYAVEYARAGKYMTDPHTVYVQSLYILNNITHWRGPLAKEVRETLKAVPKA